MRPPAARTSPPQMSVSSEETFFPSQETIIPSEGKIVTSEDTNVPSEGKNIIGERRRITVGEVFCRREEETDKTKEEGFSDGLSAEIQEEKRIKGISGRGKRSIKKKNYICKCEMPGHAERKDSRTAYRHSDRLRPKLKRQNRSRPDPDNIRYGKTLNPAI